MVQPVGDKQPGDGTVVGFNPVFKNILTAFKKNDQFKFKW